MSEKLGITKTCLAIENKQLKCGDYSLFFQCSWMTMNNISTSDGLNFVVNLFHGCLLHLESIFIEDPLFSIP